MPKHDERLGHLLWEVSVRVMALGDPWFAKLELSHAALGVLDIIATQPGIAIAEIARQQPKTQQAVSQVVARLETLGLVVRKLVRGRTIALHLTAAGTRARNAGAAAEIAFERGIEEILGRATYERLRKALIEARAVLVTRTPS